METHNTREVEEVNYETRDYDGIRWIRYDHYEHALHHQLQKARQEERERAVEIIKDELRDAPLEIQMTKGIIFASIIGRIVDPT